jgi:hypothetical protein
LLPDAKHRLKAGDRIQLALFSRRFAPAACVTLDSGSVLRLHGDRLGEIADVRQIGASGRVRRAKNVVKKVS